MISISASVQPLMLAMPSMNDIWKETENHSKTFSDNINYSSARITLTAVIACKLLNFEISSLF